MFSLQDVANYFRDKPRYGVGGIPIDGVDPYARDDLSTGEQQQLDTSDITNAQPASPANPNGVPGDVTVNPHTDFKQGMQVVGEGAKRAAQDMALGAANFVTTDPMYMYGMGQAAVNAVERGHTTDATLNDDSYNFIQDQKAKFYQETQKINPGADPARVESLYKAYTNTPEYQQMLGSLMHTSGIEMGNKQMQHNSDAVGLPVSEQGVGDALIQGGTAALIPNPIGAASIIEKAGTAARIPTMITKPAAAIADAMTGTGSPMTKEGIHIGTGVTNTIVGTALPAVKEAYNDIVANQAQPQSVPSVPDQSMLGYDPNRAIQLPQVAVDTGTPTIAPAVQQSKLPVTVAQLAPLRGPNNTGISLDPISSAMAAEQNNVQGNINPPIVGTQPPPNKVNIPKPIGSDSGWSPATVGAAALGTVAGLAMLTPLGRQAARAFARPAEGEAVRLNPNTTMMDMNEAAQQARQARNLVPDTMGGSGPVSNAVRYIDQGTNSIAPIEHVGMDLGGQAASDRLIGTYQGYLSHEAERQATNNWYSNAQLPTGGVLPHTPSDIVAARIALTPEQNDLLTRSIIAENVGRVRQRAYDDAVTNLNDLTTDPGASIQSINKAKGLVDNINNDNLLWVAHDDIKTADIQDLINQRNADPAVKAVADAMDANNKALLAIEKRRGVITPLEYKQRVAQDNYSPLGQFDTTGNRSDESVRRASYVTDDNGNPVTRASQVGNPVQNSQQYIDSMDPVQAMVKQGIARVNAIQENVGKKVFMRQLMAYDKGAEKEVYVWGSRDLPDEVKKNGGIVTTYVAGKPFRFQTGRRIIADVVNAEGQDLHGFTDSVLSRGKALFQMFTTGGIHAPFTAAKALKFDTLNLGITQKIGNPHSLTSLVLQAAAHKIAPGSKTAEMIASMIGRVPLGLDAIPQTAYVVAYQNARHAAISVAHKALNDALANKPWTVAIPGFKQRLVSAATAMVDHFENDLIGNLERLNVMPVHGMLRDGQLIRKALYNSGTMFDRAIQPVASAHAQWLGLINTIHVAPMLTQAINSRMLHEIKLGRKLTDPELMTLGGQVSNAVGNYQIRPIGFVAKKGQSTRGNVISAANKFFSATTPYLTIGLQTFRSVGKALVGQGIHNGFATAAGMSALLAAHYKSGKQFDDWSPEASDWYHNKLSALDRLTTLYIPTPDAIMNGFGKFDPANPTAKFIRWGIAPELAWFSTIGHHALNAMGLTTNPSNAVAEHPMQDIMTATQRATGLDYPQFLPIIAAMGGQNLSLANAAAGHGMLSPDPRPKHQGVQGESGLYDNAGTIIDAVMGASGTMVNHLMDDAYGAHFRGQDLDEIARKLGVGVAESLARSTTDIPLLYKANEKFSTSTPEADFVHENKDALKMINDQIQLDVGKKSYIWTGSPTIMNDPRLLPMAEVAARLGGGLIKPWQTMYQNDADTLANLRNNRTAYSASQILDGTYQKALDAQIRVVQGSEARLAQAFDKANAAIANMPQISRQLKEAGFEPTIQGILKALQANVSARHQ